MKKGQYCRFVDGVKTYKDKRTAILAFRMQTKAYEDGYAPPVIEWISGIAFRTAIADTSEFDAMPRGSKLHKEFPELAAYSKALFEEFTGQSKVDMHRGNLGRWRGKIVLIDFS